jgi:hypothetical protein
MRCQDTSGYNNRGEEFAIPCQAGTDTTMIILQYPSRRQPWVKAAAIKPDFHRDPRRPTSPQATMRVLPQLGN